ncbi:hypothetical protein Avbf_08125 [Armadillidium vulgare]|nr:hypothetical protein Avbf_08125 [Armadillidium vulgare]
MFSYDRFKKEVNNEEEAYRLNYQLTEGLKNLKAKNSLKKENKNSEEENIDSRDSRTFVQDPKFWPDEDDFDSDHSFTTEENTDEVAKGEEIQIRQNLQQISRNSNLTHQIDWQNHLKFSAKEGAFIKWTKGEYVSIIETEFVLPHFYKRSNNEIKYKRVIRSPEGFSLTGTVHFQTLVEVIDFHSNESLPQHLKFGIPFNKSIQTHLKTNPYLS